MSRLSYAAGLALPIAVVAAFVGPAYTTPRDKPAGQPFVYAMPAGFTPIDAHIAGQPGGQRAVFVHASLGTGGLTPNVSITHVNDMAPFDDAKLAMIAAGMPALFVPGGVQWREVRHAQVKRRDGALVGLLEGENSLGEEHYRSLQVSFPDDRGATLVTANFPSFEASHWVPIFEAAMEATRGVATRGVRTPVWVYVAWGGGAGCVSFLLLLALLAGRANRPAVPVQG